MKRHEKFLEMINHPINGKLIKKLNTSEKFEVVQFLVDREHLSDDDFMFQANRWYLDTKEKPKHLTEMWAIVTQCK